MLVAFSALPDRDTCDEQKSLEFFGGFLSKQAIEWKDAWGLVATSVFSTLVSVA